MKRLTILNIFLSIIGLILTSCATRPTETSTTTTSTSQTVTQPTTTHTTTTTVTPNAGYH